MLRTTEQGRKNLRAHIGRGGVTVKTEWVTALLDDFDDLRAALTFYRDGIGRCFGSGALCASGYQAPDDGATARKALEEKS